MAIKTLKVRLYPNDDQNTLLMKHFGANRFVWNHFLEASIKYYAESKATGKPQGLNYFKTCGMLTELKKDKEWLFETNSQSLQQTLRKLDNSFTAFFRKNSEYPEFKSRKGNQYFIVQAYSRIEGGRIIITKFHGGIAFRDHFDTSKIRKIKQIVITKDADRYYASIQYETDVVPDGGHGLAGIDMGVEHFMTTSDGIRVEPLNQFRKMERKLNREQRRLSRRKKGSSNGVKQKVKLQKIYQQVRDARMDFNHRVSSAIAKHYGTVVVESLNIRGMQKDHHIAKSISDQGWHQFVTMLKYKVQWRGGDLIEIGRFEPSSRICSRCGNIKHDLKLSDRIYHCDVCGLSIDRDLNAAINILNIGLLKVGKGIPEFTPVESVTTAELSKGGLRVVHSLKQEPYSVVGRCQDITFWL